MARYIVGGLREMLAMFTDRESPQSRHMNGTRRLTGVVAGSMRYARTELNGSVEELIVLSISENRDA